MKYKFEDLEVWRISLDLGDCIYESAAVLPDMERFNLNSQMIRASTSISLNIAEGSTSQSNGEQKRFIGYSIRSLIEVIACLRIIDRRGYLINDELRNITEELCDQLFIKLQAFRNALK
ncbi:MAG: four helix bundle protein [Balneolaceae bacterium]|nr:four helix bundle protein [Balneolaceae bacterium]MCH8549462.1 four helix bundle protein [Balneolaceae bacterium]